MTHGKGGPEDSDEARSSLWVPDDSYAQMM